LAMLRQILSQHWPIFFSFATADLAINKII
jgi:hypothetical protein